MNTYRTLLFGGVSSVAAIVYVAASSSCFADSSATPAWAAPAQMNPDYVKGGSSAAASTSTPAWAAPAQMNPDYKKGEAPAVKAAEEPPPPTGGQATTSYYGGSEAPKNAAWAAEATMNPDYQKGTSAPAASTAASSTPSAAPVRDTALEACSAAIRTAAAAAKLYFELGSSTLGPGAAASLKALAAAAKACGNVTIEVSGHTDNLGSPQANKMLSEQRAKSVVELLIQAGADGSKLKAVGYGQENPITTNETPEGRRLNRRIEFLVTSH